MAALRYAASLAKQLDASLILLHVIDSLVAPPEMEYVHLNIKDFNAERERHANNKLAALGQKEVDPAIPTTPLLRHGPPWEQIKDTARDDSERHRPTNRIATCSQRRRERHKPPPGDVQG